MKLSAYLIHNHDPERLVYRDTVTSLLSKHGIRVTEITDQPAFAEPTISLAKRISFLFSQINRIIFDFKLRYSRRRSRPRYVLTLVFHIARSTSDILFSTRRHIIALIRKNFIEKTIAQKHLAAWQHALSTSSDIILVFEDDVICHSNTSRELSRIIQYLTTQNLADTPLYIDLAGGYQCADLFPNHIRLEGPLGSIRINNILTNTACGYLLTSCLSKQLLNISRLSKTSHDFPIDFLINSLSQSLRPISPISLHFDPPPFAHGSFTNEVFSWQLTD